MIEEHFDNLTNYMGGLHPDLASWFDLLLALAKKGLLDDKILYKTEMENDSVHPAVREWLKDNLETLRSSSQTEWTSAEDETLEELHDVFNKAFFRGALSPARNPLEFIRKNNTDGSPNKKWTSSKAGLSQPDGALPGSRRSVIRIYETSLDSGDRLKYYMNVLLHEMIHSLEINYCCRCHSCNSGLQDFWGQTGHGVGFIKLLKKAQAFAKRMMNIDLHVGLREGLATEIYALQEKQLEIEWPWEELGLSESEMMEAAEWCRKRKASEQIQDSAPGDETLDQ